jgi:hypothetical protein
MSEAVFVPMLSLGEQPKVAFKLPRTPNDFGWRTPLDFLRNCYGNCEAGWADEPTGRATVGVSRYG